MGGQADENSARAVAGLAHAWSSERLVFRPVSADDDADVSFLHAVNGDPADAAMSGGLLRPWSRNSAKELAGALERSLLAVMVCLRAAPQEAEEEEEEAAGAKPLPVGFLCLGYGGGGGGESALQPTAQNRTAPLGIAIASAYQGKGYGTEAIRWALDWAFRFANLHSVGLDVVEYNDRARRVYKKVGFVYEGRSREVVFCGGKYWDLIHYSILDREWEAVCAREYGSTGTSTE